MRPTLVGLVLFALLPGAARGGTILLGGFRPVAAEEGTRALWVNPAAIGTTGGSSALFELVWLGAPDDDALFDELHAYSIGISTDKLAYGFQWEFDDIEGVPDWMLSVGQRGGVNLRWGYSVDYKSGEESKLDGTIGIRLPLGSSLQGALVVDDVFEADSDGAKTERTWRWGGAFRTLELTGALTYDGIHPEGGDTQHWFAFSLDRTQKLHLGFAMNTDGDWNATVDVAFPNYLIGAGTRKPKEGRRRDFVSAEWFLKPIPGVPRGHR